VSAEHRDHGRFVVGIGPGEKCGELPGISTLVAHKTSPDILPSAYFDAGIAVSVGVFFDTGARSGNFVTALACGCAPKRAGDIFASEFVVR
jgi:hypothetical protein